MDMTDEQLIEQRQFGDLLERYRGCCYRRASQILRDPDLAEDAVQEAFVRAYRDLEAGRFRGVSALATWLYRIVSNAALTIREKEKRKPEAIGDEEEDWVERLLGVDPSLSPDESLILQELIGRVREAVASLPKDCRDAVMLIHFRGRSYRETARELNVAVSTVKYRVVYGENLLRERLRPYLEETLPSPPRLPEFQGEHITLQEYEALPDEEKVRYFESARGRNVEWLEGAFQTRRAAWLLVIDGKIHRSGRSLQDFPAPEEFLSICRREGKYPFVFFYPLATAVEEASAPWHRTIFPGDWYPALTIHLVADQAVATVDADLDTGSIEIFADIEWLNERGVAQNISSLPRTKGRHSCPPYEYTFSPLADQTIEVVDEGGRARQYGQCLIIGVWDWPQSPFVYIIPFSVRNGLLWSAEVSASARAAAETAALPKYHF